LHELDIKNINLHLIINYVSLSGCFAVIF
jgi:hypothetical protein